MKKIGLTVASLAISLLAAGPLHAQPDANYLAGLLRPTPASVPDHNCVICRPTAPLYAPPPDANYPLALLPLPPASGPPVKNCIFCHGAFAQGLGVAPRLAGQRAAYIEKELGAFRSHVRDNPSPRSTCGTPSLISIPRPRGRWRTISPMWRRAPPRTAIARWPRRGMSFPITARRTPISSTAWSATARTRKACETFHVSPVFRTPL